MSTDIALDKDTHDLLIEGNELLLVNDVDQIEQNLKIRLKFFSGEWFLDITQGLPFYDTILVKNPNVPNIDNIIKAEIIDTPGVTELLSYDSSYDASLREYVVDFKVRTIFGEAELEVSLFN